MKKNLSLKRPSKWDSSVFKSYRTLYVVTLVACVVDYVGGFIDNAVGGRLLGEDVLSSLSVTAPVMLLFSLMGNLLAGGSILASQELGAGNQEKAKAYYRKTIIITIVEAIVIMAVVMLFSGQICRFLCGNSSAGVIENAVQYLNWFSPTAVPFLLIFVLTGFLRLDGAQDIPMKSTIVLTVSDIALDFLLAPIWGIKGLARATTISYTLGLLVFIFYFKRKDRFFKFSKGTPEKAGLGNILITGAPIALNRFGNFVNAAFLNYLVFSLASDAGGVIFNVRSQCMNITMALLFGAIQAGVPELGKLYGAKAKDRIQEIKKLIVCSALTHGAILAVVCILLRDPLLGMFGVDIKSAAFHEAGFALICLGIDLILKAVTSSVIIIYQVTGREKLSNVLSILETLLLLIPMEFAFSLKFGIRGLWFGALVSDIILVVIMCFNHFSHCRKPKY